VNKISPPEELVATTNNIPVAFSASFLCEPWFETRWGFGEPSLVSTFQRFLDPRPLISFDIPYYIRLLYVVVKV